MRKMLTPLLLCLLIACKSKETKTSSDTTVVDSAAAPPETAPPGVDVLPAGMVLLQLGDLKSGQTPDEVVRVLGEPENKSQALEWGADGMMHEDWTWKSKGLTVNFESEKGSTDPRLAVFSITARNPCPLKTLAGIGVGNSEEEVRQAYEGKINTEESGDDQIIIGSMYGGIIFTLQDKKVVSIFLGAAAE